MNNKANLLASMTFGTVFLTAVLSGCGSPKAETSETPSSVKPIVKYEFSGGAGHYDYAPSFIQDEYGIIYGFICENRDPFQIVDYIYLYKGIPTPDGIRWQPGTPIIAPSADGWDDCHICDPDVRRFTTRYKGETYDWIMTYLGVDQWDCNHNQIGLAVAKNIEGPYTKVDVNPIIPYEGRDKWGTGQSTSIVMNDSTIAIFYHATTDNGPFAMREIDLRDIDNIILGEEIKFPSNHGNTYPALSDDYIYVVVEDRSEEYDRSVIPTWVGDICRVMRKPRSLGFISDGGIDDWTEIGRVTPADSKFPRNHNPGFLTDTKGYLIDEDTLTVFFTPAVTGPDWLWSYDLYSARFPMDGVSK